MAATLKFEVRGTTYEAVPVKLERRKLYGYTDVVATDGSGEICQSARLDPDGTLIVPPGGVKTALLSAEGRWIDRAELKAVDAAGNDLPIVPSSFNDVIAVTEKAEEEAFLDHAWKSVYQLVNPDLAAALGEDIFAFPFNYRTDACPDEGFLLAANGLVYLFSGERIVRDFTGLEETSELEIEDEETPPEEDELDFSMM